MKAESILQAGDLIFSQVGKELRIGAPLGLGKPNQLLNHLFDRVSQDPTLKMHLFTALSLALPQAKTDLERKFLTPFSERHFGSNYPDLKYVQAQKSQKLPPNVRVSEFYFQSGALLGSKDAQRDYVSLNYTHVAQSLVNDNINIIVQLIAARTVNGKTTFSLSCNTDLTLDVKDLMKKNGRPLMLVGVIHPDLPYMGADAEVGEDFFDLIVDSPEVRHPLFALPRTSVDDVDHAIGFHASRLIKDDGTLQIGIGSLSDSLVHSLILREKNNSNYLELIRDFPSLHPHQVDSLPLEHGLFEKGLYGTSEMVMDGFMHLRKAGILKRLVKDLGENIQRYLHGAFFLGSKEFYQWLSELQDQDFSGLCMTRVSKVNDLYDENELALRRQRKNARFVNTCMQVTLLGAAASETLEDGRVVSGVGGQYNFVAMAQELPDAHSMLLLRSTRTHKGVRSSNIVWSHGHLTIPRHLRDIVITEYGIANLKGKSDEDVIKALIEISDSEFQNDLISIAKKNGKLSLEYKLPSSAASNTPEKIFNFHQQNRALFPPYPFGSDFSSTEQNLALALTALKETSHSKTALLGLLIKGCCVKASAYKSELQRMELFEPKTLKDHVFQRLVLATLEQKIGGKPWEK